MSREIKFDMIVKNNYTGDLHHKKYSLKQLMTGIENLFDIENYTSVADRQYTGLKDKNGIDVFESDIVICVNGHKGVIEWESNDCCFNVTGYYSSSDDYPTMAFMEGQPFEVIGNIWENEEIIKQMEGEE